MLYKPEAQIVILSALQWAIFRVIAQFGEYSPKDTQMTSTCSMSKVHICMPHTSPTPKFSSVSLNDEPFSSYVPLFGKVHWMIPKWHWYVQGQRYTYVYFTYTSGTQIFICFTLQRAAFELQLNLGEKVLNNPQNDLDMFQIKGAHMHTTYIREAQISIRFPLWWPAFEFYPFFGKVHQMTPSDLDMFKVKKTNIHATYTPEAQIFFGFSLRWDVFELQLNLGKTNTE